MKRKAYNSYDQQYCGKLSVINLLKRLKINIFATIEDTA